MEENILTQLKADLLAKYSNEKYYAQDELIILSKKTDISQKEKVERASELIDVLVKIDNSINMVNSVFIDVNNDSDQSGVTENNKTDQPNNVVEQQPLQTTHSE